MGSGFQRFDRSSQAWCIGLTIGPTIKLRLKQGNSAGLWRLRPIYRSGKQKKKRCSALTPLKWKRQTRLICWTVLSIKSLHFCYDNNFEGFLFCFSTTQDIKRKWNKVYSKENLRQTFKSRMAVSEPRMRLVGGILGESHSEHLQPPPPPPPKSNSPAPEI